MSRNLIIAILILALVVGLGFLIVNKNNISEVETPAVVVPEVPVPSEEEPIDKFAELGSNVTLKVGESTLFKDGLKVTVKRINDSRCKDGMVCVWQGELSTLINVSGGKIKTPAELVLGTENYKTQSLDGYTFSLKSSTESSITFSVVYQKPVVTSGGCYVGGCSGQICSDQQDVMSTCEYREEYVCYKTAICERQSTGQCGWTQTSALKACLAN